MSSPRPGEAGTFGAAVRLALRPEAPFDFAATAYSHGWVVLAPNEWEGETETVRRVHRLEGGTVVLLEMRASPETDGGGESGPGVEVTVRAPEALGPTERKEIRAAVTRMFRLDEELSEFYALCEERGGRWERVPRGLGRLLRSPTLFEDVVKTILTTNVQWGGTKRMARELVRAYGDPYPEDPDRRAFPAPEAIAADSPEAFGAAVGLGYRAPYVHEVAARVASGELDLEGLAESDLPTTELKRELLAIKGVGPYAAATLLMLVGRYDELAVDSVFREFVSERYFGGERPGDAEARAVYEPWGRWKYLAYWFDLWAGLEESL